VITCLTRPSCAGWWSWEDPWGRWTSYGLQFHCELTTESLAMIEPHFPRQAFAGLADGVRTAEPFGRTIIARWVSLVREPRSQVGARVG